MSDRGAAGATSAGRACSHGLTTGICVDDMTPAAREAFDFTFRHAYDYAVQGGDRDAAEEYASWYVRTYFVDSLDDGPNHHTGAAAWRASMAPTAAKRDPGAGRRIDAARRVKIRNEERKAARAAAKESAA